VTAPDLSNIESRVAALVNIARQSTKNELVARRKAQRERHAAFWDDCYDLLGTFACECIPDSYESDGKVYNCETALENVRKKLRRCQAQTREGFIAWAVRMLAKEPHFHLVADAINSFDLDVSDWLDTATLRQGRYADFPEHYKDGDLYRVKMGESDGVPIVWTIPEQFWGYVKTLWPVSLKQRANGAYFIAKQTAGQTIPAHRLIVNCAPGDTVQSVSGNFLDWSSLYVRPFNLSGIYKGRNTSWDKEAGRPRTVQEEFEHRFQSRKALENCGTNSDCTEIFSTPQPIPVNADLAATAMHFGKVVKTGWVPSITPAERDQYATERFAPQSARLRAAAKALDQLGL